MLGVIRREPSPGAESRWATDSTGGTSHTIAEPAREQDRRCAESEGFGAGILADPAREYVQSHPTPNGIGVGLATRCVP
jgi:hypothetical protein